MRLMLLFVLLLSAGCATTNKTPKEAPPAQANLYTKYYVSYDKPSIAASGLPPRIYRGQDQETDFRKLLEDGYDILGYSSFVAGDVAPEQAMEQGTKVSADLILVYTRHSGMKPLNVPQKQKPPVKPADQARDEQPGPASGRLITPKAPDYEYFASYWTRLPPPVLGLHVQAPDKGKPAEGLPVLAVIKNSPAAEADIKAGDLLLRIGDTDMRSIDALMTTTQRYAGQSVEIVFAHDAETRHKTVVLNTKSD